MIHTATLTYRPTTELYNRFIETAHFDKNLSKSGEYVNADFSNQGIQVFGYCCFKEDYGAAFLICRVNFKRLIEQKDHITVYRDRDLIPVIESFDRIMDSICGLPHFEEWNAYRVDYCVNVRTPYAATYIKLMQKGKVPHFLRWPRDKDTGKIVKKPGSVYLVSKVRDKEDSNEVGSVTVNFYDKQSQLRRKRKYDIKRTGKSKITDAIIEQGKDILRLEVQCHAQKIKSLKRDKDLPDRRMITLLEYPGIAKQVIGYYVDAIATRADYHRKPVALKLVDKLRYEDKTKENMKTIINALSVQREDVDKVHKELVDGGIMTDHQFSYAIGLLIKNGINPVVISEDEPLAGKSYKDGLENVFTLFWNAYWDELYSGLPEDQIEEITEIEEIL